MDQVTQKSRLLTIHRLLVVCVTVAGLSVAVEAQQQMAKSSAGSKNANREATPVTAPVVPAQYLVGEGDLLRVSVWKEAEVSQNVVVRPDGMISVPLISEVRVAGLTPGQIQEMVTEKLKAVLTNPQVTVTVVEVRSKDVYITGEVGKPGAYQAIAPMNVLQLIARAGGLREFANRKAIYIFRASDPKTRIRFNYNEVVSGRRPQQNIYLQPGDTVVVP